MKRLKNDSHIMVFYWKAKDKIVTADKFGIVEIEYLSVGIVTFYRTLTLSRMPKTLEFLGWL